MTRNDNLYVVAMEECSEITQAISKILRFGEEHQYDNAKDNNAKDFLREYYQLQAVVEMIIERGQLEGRFKDFTPEQIELVKHHKKENVRYYAEVSRSLGRIGRPKTQSKESTLCV